jgi:oligopeptidase B
MISRIQETDSTIPVKHGEFSYYSRTETGQPYSIFCRKLNSPGASEEILLDLNTLASANRYSYLELGIFKISPNHQLLAYSVDTNGSEDFVMYIKDLTTGGLWPECIHQVAYSAEWTNDNQTLFYTIQDQTKRSYKLLQHRLGTDPAEDVLVYHESDERYDLSLS